MACPSKMLEYKWPYAIISIEMRYWPFIQGVEILTDQKVRAFSLIRWTQGAHSDRMQPF